MCMVKCKEYAAVALIGTAGYPLLELLWRGQTHWSMALAGGICLPLIYRVHTAHMQLEPTRPLRRRTLCMVGRSLLCAGIITLVEFCIGVLVNLFLDWHVWDYSGLPCNLLGQVCLLYSLLWCLLSAAICPLCRTLHRYLTRDRAAAKKGAEAHSHTP